MNPLVEDIRGQLWTVYFDLRDGNISVEEALAADALLATMGQLLEFETTNQEALRKNPPPTPTTERMDSE
jgi:hypothetical protein